MTTATIAPAAVAVPASAVVVPATAQQTQAALSLLATRDLASAWQLLDVKDLRGSMPQWIGTVAGIVQRYGKASASMAADEYDAKRLAAGIKGSFSVPVADPPPLEQVAKSMKWATKGLWSDAPDVDAAQTMSTGAGAKLILDSGRLTVVNAVSADRRARGWARVLGDADPCPFCAMLASRGAVYRSEATASFEAHDHCACGVEPLFGVYTPSDQVRELQALWRSSTRGKSGDAARKAFADAYNARRAAAVALPTPAKPEEPAEDAWLTAWKASRAALPADGKDWGIDGVRGPNLDVAQQHLAHTLDAGKALSDEIDRRIAARAASSTSPDALQALEAKVAAAKEAQRLASEKYQDAVEAAWQKGIDEARKQLESGRSYSVSSDPHSAYYLDPNATPTSMRILVEDVQRIWAEEQRTKTRIDRPPGSSLARSIAYEVQRAQSTKSSPVYKSKLKAAEAGRDVERALEALVGAHKGTLEPGTAAYAAALREETLKLLAELRPMGGQQTYLNSKRTQIKSGQLIESMRFAEQAYPADWHAGLASFLSRRAGGGIDLGTSQRGYNQGAYKIRISVQTGRGHLPAGDTNGQYQVATHELGHSFETTQPGLTVAEWAFSNKRSPRATAKRISLGPGERSLEDEWANNYTGKVYNDNPTTAWEMFTTGIESLVAGSPYMQREGALGYDYEFRSFILGVLSVL